jgi:hypothetical protein
MLKKHLGHPLIYSPTDDTPEGGRREQQREREERKVRRGREPARAIPTPRGVTWAPEIVSIGNLHSEYFLGPGKIFWGS